MTDEALRAAATVIAQRFMNRAQPVDDLTILADQYLRSEERVLACRQDLTTFAQAAGFTVKSETTMQDALAELAPQLGVKPEAIAQANAVAKADA